MSIRWIVGAVAGACVVGFVAGRAWSGDSDDRTAWEALNRLGAQHERLGQLAGTWTVKARVRDAKTGTFTESDASAVFTPVLGGRFVRQELKGKMMGGAFEGIGYLGYENATGKYVSLWLDNLGTGWETGTGTEEETKKSITYSMTMHGPGGAEVKARDVVTRVSEGEFTFQNYASIDGPEQLWMEFRYRRP